MVFRFWNDGKKIKRRVIFHDMIILWNSNFSIQVLSMATCSTASEMGGYEKAWNTICLFTEKICWSNSWTRRRTLGFHILNLYQMVILYVVIQSSFSFRKSQFSGNTSHIIALVTFDCEFWIYLLYNRNQFFFPKGIISLSSSAFIRALKESLSVA